MTLLIDPPGKSSPSLGRTEDHPIDAQSDKNTSCGYQCKPKPP